MKLLRLFTLCLIITTAAGASIAAECNVGDFKAKDSGQLSVIQKLSYLNRMTEEEFSRRKQEADTGGQYGIISGYGTFSDMKEDTQKRMSEISFDQYGKYEKAWAQSSLDDNGLKAYVECLEHQGGFNLVVSSITKQNFKLIVSWSPGFNQSLTEPVVIVQKENVANIADLASELGSDPWGTARVQRELTLSWTDASRPAVITLRAGNVTNTTTVLALVRVAPTPVVQVDSSRRYLGGAFDQKGDQCSTANPKTGACSCPEGFSALDLTHAGYVVCLSEKSNSTAYAWGGAYDRRGNECAGGNPLTGNCSCPAGFTDLDLVDAGIVLCLGGSDQSTGLSWGGSYDIYGECQAKNPVTGYCSCPDGYEDLALEDSGTHYCFKR